MARKPLCLGNGGSCRGYFSGHILGFGEDELGTVQTISVKFHFDLCPRGSVLLWKTSKIMSTSICWKCNLQQRWPVQYSLTINFLGSLSFISTPETWKKQSRKMGVGNKREFDLREKISNAYWYLWISWVICLYSLSENLSTYPCLLK